MNTSTLTGLALGAGGAGVFGYQALSSLMDKENAWQDLTLATVTNDRVAGIVEAMPSGFMEKGLHYLAYDLPLYQLLLAAGVVFILFGAVFRK
ncbi:MAG: hypothetical protein GY737_30460 [Desulfobacteraceae bacterium]|nr:hypothetical protein [Desulfobacteraceae bacterium]